MSKPLCHPHPPAWVVLEEGLNHELCKLEVCIGQFKLAQVKHTNDLLLAGWQRRDSGVQHVGAEAFAVTDWELACAATDTGGITGL